MTITLTNTDSKFAAVITTHDKNKPGEIASCLEGNREFVVFDLYNGIVERCIIPREVLQKCIIDFKR